MSPVSHSGRHRSRFAAWTAAIAVAMLAAGGLARADSAASPAQLQDLAQRAALAGAAVFASAEQSAEDDISSRAVAAAQDVIAGQPGVQAQVVHSAEERRVTVNVSARGPGRYRISVGAPTGATAVAHYVVADQPARWAWAPRQHFAARVRGWRLAQSPAPNSSANR